MFRSLLKNIYLLRIIFSETEQVVEGLDAAVIKMKKGEVALLTIAPEYGFGSFESKQELATVPPNSTLYYEVELVSFEKVSLMILISPDVSNDASFRGHLTLITSCYRRKNLGI